jgi:hypothetical protein
MFRHNVFNRSMSVYFLGLHVGVLLGARTRSLVRSTAQQTRLFLRRDCCRTCTPGERVQARRTPGGPGFSRAIPWPLLLTGVIQGLLKAAREGSQRKSRTPSRAAGRAGHRVLALRAHDAVFEVVHPPPLPAPAHQVNLHSDSYISGVHTESVCQNVQLIDQHI